ncbi:LOW QUALITY PROTEIN: cytoplasmic dynein 2 heavy chain 1-like [Anthonomus grandis grandis]|uniref:LOW QUALITY PROTEIN: cytoplasmic dynein 2 heavy chain 1-like n=1 Tax=Anthonomus grandis grandis TaxID=2921223 RepID=UPI002165706E|nr:LOW QUALITY PROTEIN: cytoplasmic dynein 2 heavy chain 1-like [Anthonomus grandis grandis]
MKTIIVPFRDVWSWIICDGDVDPEWVESLNSVLDDNRLMTLPSGWRIHFRANVNFVFETHELKNASPATISRMGIVYLTSPNLDDFLKSVSERLEEEKRGYIEPLLNEYFAKSIEWAMSNGESTLERSIISVAKSALIQMKDSSSKQQFIVNLINGIGSQLKLEHRQTFAEQIFEWTEETPPPHLLKLFYDKSSESIDTYRTDPTISADNIDRGIPLIKTGQVLKYLDSIGELLKESLGEHFLMVGPHGSAKRLYIQEVLQDRSDVELVEIHCSPNLSTNYIMQKLLQKCFSVNTFKGTVLKPKKGHLVLYLRNMHLLAPDRWGSNSIVEFLTQLIEYNGFFNPKTEFIQVGGILIIGTLLSSQKISPRFLSKLHLINVELPDQEDLSVILVAYLSAIIKSYFPTISFPKPKVVKLALTLITLYQKVQEKFSMQNRNVGSVSPHELIRWATNFKYYSTLDGSEFEAHILEVLCYEAIKIFGDRLSRPEERQYLISILNDVIKSHWEVSGTVQKALNHFYIPKLDVPSKRIIFDQYNKENWEAEVQRGIVQYGKENEEQLNTIVNDEILLLTSAVVRSAVLEGHHLLLIGKSGVGRKTSIKITSALQSKRIIHPTSMSYPLFHNDLKMAVQLAGLEGEDVFLILEDFIFTNDQNLTIVNLLMCSGEVSDLYSDIEFESIIKGLKDKSDTDNFEGDLTDYFANNIRKRLHVFICLDEDNRNIILKCPAFFHNSGVLWLGAWSDDTVRAFPSKLITLLGGIDSQESSEAFHAIYKSVPTTTPTRYIAMIKFYFSTCKEKESSINAKIAKLEGGVSKLNTAKELVSELKQKAAEQQEKLAEKQSKANAALDMISNTIKGANAHKEEMQVLKAKTENENVQLVKRKAEIDIELSEVEPLIQEARAAVGNIKTESLSEIRSLRAPPEVIRDILEGVLKLMGTQDTSWNSMKTFLAKRGIKEEIRSFDANRIQTENRQAVERLMSMKRDSFDQKFAKRASVAAAPLAAWVDANVKYSKVLDKIRPLEREQHKLKENLSSAENQLVELNANLSDVDATVAKLKDQLSQYTKEAAEIEIGLNEVNRTLNAAESLVFKLEDEYKRWQEQLDEFSAELSILPKNCLLAAAFATFLSKEGENVRRDTLAQWSAQLGNPKFDFMSFFSSEREQIQWQSEGLPNDKVSLENSVVIKKGNLFPLLIDPNSMAVQWLKNHLAKSNQRGFEHVTVNSSKFHTIVEASIRFGKILIIEDLEEIPYSLFGLLRGDFICQGERKMIRLQGRQIDYHPDCKVIMCSRNEHLSLPSEIESYVCVLNFNVTYSGFVEQLLSAAIMQEKPELESRRKQLLHENEDLQEKLYSLQMQLLDCLANSDGNILNNTNLLNTLNETKSNSVAVSNALEESKKVSAAVRKEYEIFLEIAEFASQLYFSCKMFTDYNILYSLSASAFNRLFLLCLPDGQSKLQESETQNKKQLFETVYNYMSRGMFKQDRLPFFFHLMYRMYPSQIPRDHMNLFLTNGGYQRVIDEDSNDFPSWVPPGCISSLRGLKNSLPELYSKCQLSERNLWSGFMESIECEKEFPKQFTVTEFERLLIVQILRPDRLLSSIENTCLRISGLRTVDPPVLNLHSVLSESNANEPILLITTSGMDPSSEICELAKQINQGFEEISMGEGKEALALTKLETCRNSGKWLILKNLHLVSCWLPTLAQNVKHKVSSTAFRLWLISETTDKFNAVLAQNSLKIAYEEPPGVANNMRRIYSSLGEKYDNKLNRTSARIFFVFTCLHAILQERRKYIPQGWLKYYEFNHTDMQTSLNLTEDLWNVDTTRVQWPSITGLINEAVYAGRIENVDDLNILNGYLKIYFRDDVLSHKWKPYGVTVSLPNSGENKEYLQVIKKLPNKDSPSMFGLPENIDRAREKQLSYEIIKSLKEFYQKQTTTFKDVNFKELHPVFSMWKKLNQGFDFIKLTLTEDYQGESAVGRFIFEEYTRGVTLIQTIHKCFTNLNKMSKGVAEAEESYVAIVRSILKSKTPKQWLNVWDGPKDSSQYLQDLLQKTAYLATLKLKNTLDLIKQPLKLGLFFNPQSILACSKQDYSRSSNVPLDNLGLHTTWDNAANTAIVLSHLLIEGGILENKMLKLCRSDSESITTVPCCYLSWIEKVRLQDEDYAKVPLYANTKRENKIITLEIECDANYRDQFILSGLAFYLKH